MKEGRKEMVFLTMHSTQFIYSYISLCCTSGTVLLNDCIIPVACGTYHSSDHHFINEILVPIRHIKILVKTFIDNNLTKIGNTIAICLARYAIFKLTILYVM